jgi:two-component system NtrC family sensor kinase
MSEMHVGLTRIKELVEKLRTFSRLDEGEIKQVSVRDSIASVLMILGHRLQDRIQVATSFGEPDRIECYASLLNQAVMNLLTNAIDACGERGSIEISTGVEAGLYKISITDTGKGIPEELRHRVFDPFFTTKPIGQGTGLGLSIAYSIIEKHGGKLELQRAESGGTRAVIRLPLAAAP